MYILTSKIHGLLRGAIIKIQFIFRYLVFHVTILTSTERPYGLDQRIICVQTVLPNYYSAKYLNWIFSRQRSHAYLNEIYS